VLAPAAFVDVILGIHILAAIAGFGVTFAYPVFLLTGARLEPTAMPWFFRMLQLIARRLIYPALIVILLAGIYLASDEHQFSAFYVQWGFFAVIVLGAIEGAILAPRVRQLIELSEHDLARAPSQGAQDGFAFGTDYEATLGQLKLAGGAQSLIVIITVLLMATHAGA
jgi:hypothetical protein